MNLDPQMVQAVLAANADNPQYQVLARQQKMADSMRQRGFSQVDPVQAGRRILPNYGGALANVASSYGASKMQPGIDAGMKSVNDQNAAARKQYLDALMATMRRTTPLDPSMRQPTASPAAMPGPPMQPGYT